MTPTENRLPNWLNLVETRTAFPGLRYTQSRFEPVRWAIFFVEKFSAYRIKTRPSQKSKGAVFPSEAASGTAGRT